MNEQEKQQALANVKKSLEHRQVAAKGIRRNSFEQWGNDKCISRIMDTIRAMKQGVASESQYRYWLKH